ncbi:MAG: hypothetical protein ABI655_03265 [Phenylobacterium sp.]
MTPLILALALFQAPDPAVAQDPAPPPPVEAPIPPGAPREDYPFVAWCYGVLRGYLDMHDEVMPEVTRIERTFHNPQVKLSDDLKVYEDQQRQGRADLKRFQAALTAAEKASLRPINAQGAAAVRKGRATWTAGPDVTPARKAQAWMSWTLPARCPVIAETLETRARLMGASFQVNAEPDAPAPETAPAPAPEAPAAAEAAPAPN